jgi:LAO/AO transport system ATPase
MLDELLSRFHAHDRLALARVLTLIARGEELDALRSALTPPAVPPLIVAFTGSAGVGKSTLIGRLAERIRTNGKTVAVLACDPQSPLTGGALLGDRVRMPSRPEDSGLFIRSLAATSGHQALAEHLDLMTRALGAFGFDVILLETVGAGQGDTAVGELSDVLVLLVQPESGDELQWEKAGLLEVADVVVVHKADLAGAERTQSQVKELLSLPGCRDIPVLGVSSSKQTGLDELWSTIAACPKRQSARAADSALLLRRAQELLAERFHDRGPSIAPLIDRWKRHEMDEAEAAEGLLNLLSR